MLMNVDIAINSLSGLVFAGEAANLAGHDMRVAEHKDIHYKTKKQRCHLSMSTSYCTASHLLAIVGNWQVPTRLPAGLH